MQTAIEQALTILTWYENLPNEEVPPEHLWEDSAGLEMWWKHVEEKRDDGSSTGSGDESPETDMAENDYARYLK